MYRNLIILRIGLKADEKPKLCWAIKRYSKIVIGINKYTPGVLNLDLRRII